MAAERREPEAAGRARPAVRRRAGGRTSADGARKPARQTRLPGGRKNKYTVRLSDEEALVVQARAAVAGVSVPRLLVEAAMAGDAQTASERRALVAEFLGARRLLAKVGNNVNQLARVANATGGLPPELEATLHATVRMIARLDAATTLLSGQPNDTKAPDEKAQAEGQGRA